MHCVSEQMDVFAAMSAEYSKRLTFQLFATAEMIKKFRDGQHSDTVLLVTRITSIQFTFRHRRELGLDCDRQNTTLRSAKYQICITLLFVDVFLNFCLLII